MLLTMESNKTDLQSVEEVLADAKARHERRVEGDFGVARVSDIDLQYDSATQQYWCQINGKNSVLSHRALQSACSLIGTTSKFFDALLDPNEFARIFRKRIDEGRGSRRSGIKMILRTTNHENYRVIDAILPPNYQILDDYQILFPLVERALEEKQTIHGVSVSNFAGETNYRMLYGEPIADEKVLGQKNDFMFPSIHFHNDELGFDCGMGLSNWRSICSNVALAASWRSVKRATLPSSLQPPGIKWNHSGQLRPFFKKAEELLQKSNHYADKLRERLPVSMGTKLLADPTRLVQYFSDHHIIPGSAQKTIIDQMKAEQVETEWEWVNVNTFIAQKFEPKTRRVIEGAGHVVLMNGFETIVNHFDSSDN